MKKVDAPHVFIIDKLPCGRKIFKYSPTVVDVASRYKEAEPLTS